MIYCPICGTANRDGSKFCNECGIKFDPHMQVECPQCGTLNPATGAVCNNCGASLISPPEPAPQGSALPAKSEGGTAAPPAEIASVPAWLQDLSPSQVEVPPRAAEVKEWGGEPEGVSGWPAESLHPSEAPRPPDVEEVPGETLTPASATEAEAGTPDQEEASWSAVPMTAAAGIDLLAGIEDTLPAEPLIAQSRAATTETPGPSEGISHDIALATQDAGTAAAQARLFAEIVTPPPPSAPPGRTGRTAGQPVARLLATLPRWALYAVLIAVVALPLVLEKPILSVAQELLFQTGPAVVRRNIGATPSVLSLYDQIESLDSDAAVLVAFDYDPSTAGEMDLLAQAIVGHLMDRDVRVVAVSLLPAGAPMAQSLLETAAADQPGYAGSYGQRYVNLGYLPGQATAVRLLGQSVDLALPRDFQGNPAAGLEAMEGITAVESFDLIVELAAAQDTVRWWIEQASTPHNVPVGAGVSASLEPLALPYYETASRQLVGLVAGVPGAATYQALRSDQGPESTATSRLDAQLAGFVILVLVILVGNGVYLAHRATGREG